jgi:hypothetical protein
MTPEEKILLLKDLCARLPYGVKCYNMFSEEICELAAIELDRESTLFCFWDKRKMFYHQQIYTSEFKPYLFPLSSMTEEQKQEFLSVAGYEKREEDCGRHTETYYYDMVGHEHNFYPNSDVIDWLNKNHFDYRGLIEKGLALDATGKGIY